jgi:hypothetical protein
LVTPASLWSRRSSNPKRGAGLTMVVSGNILRTTCSPCPWFHTIRNLKKSFREKLTFVLKNSEGESMLALYDETWMNRSTSYFATASAILSAPST